MARVPPFLEELFGPGIIEAIPSSLVALDCEGTILWTNEGWSEFARANGGAEVVGRFGPGCSYLDGISSPLRGFYESMIENTVRTGEPFEQDYECSSDSTYRLMHLRVLPFGRNLLLEHSTVVERPHEHAEGAAIDARYANEHGTVLQCSNCRRMKSQQGTWDWVKPWVTRPPSNTSHGICKPCIGFYWGERLRAR